MGGKSYIVREIDGRLFYDDAVLLKSPSSLRLIDHKIRIRILKLLSREPMYPAQIAKTLKIHEQKVYYHIKQLLAAGALELTEKKDIRGTTAKKFRPKGMNYAITLTFKGKGIGSLYSEVKDSRLESFLKPFIEDERLNSKIVVGSPDPHGPFKARARDGHYAIDLALFLGHLCSLPRGFSTMLDVDADLKKSESNLILVGGPVTNLTMARVNDFLPVRFSDKKPWGIAGKQSYTDDNIGLIARIPHPYSKNHAILVFAGIRFSGTKAAVLALTRFSRLILSHYTGQDSFHAVVQGFDLDGDGRVDSVELLE